MCGGKPSCAVPSTAGASMKTFTPASIASRIETIPLTARPARTDAREMAAGASMAIAGVRSKVVDVVTLMNTSCEKRFGGIDCRPRQKSSVGERHRQAKQRKQLIDV